MASSDCGCCCDIDDDDARLCAKSCSNRSFRTTCTSAAAGAKRPPKEQVRVNEHLAAPSNQHTNRTGVSVCLPFHVHRLRDRALCLPPRARVRALYVVCWPEQSYGMLSGRTDSYMQFCAEQEPYWDEVRRDHWKCISRDHTAKVFHP